MAGHNGKYENQKILKTNVIKAKLGIIPDKMEHKTTHKSLIHVRLTMHYSDDGKFFKSQTNL